MRQPTPEQYRLARRLLAHERGAQQETVELAIAVERVWQALYLQFHNLIGPIGFHALMNRALHIAKSTCSTLTAIELLHEKDKDFLKTFQESLNTCMADLDDEKASVCFVMLIANFFWLLSTFIGKDLTMRHVRKAWPDISFEEVFSRSEEIEE